MSASRSAPAPVALSVKIYSRLLTVYPRRFRTEYSGHMLQLFRDLCRRDYARGGLARMASLWARTGWDLARTVVEEYVERGVDMDRVRFVRWSGWALLAGAILFAGGVIVGSLDPDWSDPIGGVDAFYEIGQAAGLIAGQLLLIIGMLGLRAGYAERSGAVGAAALLAAVVGAAVSFGGMLAMSHVEIGWAAWVVGLIVMTMSLTVFGVAALRYRVFTRWNLAPVLAGVVLPSLLAIRLVGSDGAALGEWAFPLGVTATALGLALLGFRMQADAAGPAAQQA